MAAYRDLPQSTLLALAAKDLAGGLPQIGTLVLAPDLLTSLMSRLASADPAARRAARRRSGEPRAPGGARAPPHRAGGAGGPARHPRAGRVLPAHQGPPDRGPGGPARRADGRDGRGVLRDTGRLAAGHGRARRPAPVPVRPGRHRGRGRPGRPGRQPRQIPRRPADRRHRPRARAQPGRPGPAPARRVRRSARARRPQGRRRAERRRRASSGSPWSPPRPTTGSGSPG